MADATASPLLAQTTTVASTSAAAAPPPPPPPAAAIASTSKLNPHSAAFSFLQPDQVPATTNYSQQPAYDHRNPPSFQPPYHQPYSYPPLISGYSSNYQVELQQQQQQQQGGGYGWSASAPKSHGGGGGGRWQQQQQQQMPSYYQHAPPPPRPPLPSNHPSHQNGIYLPLANSHPFSHQSPQLQPATNTTLLPPFEPTTTRPSPLFSPNTPITATPRLVGLSHPPSAAPHPLQPHRARRARPPPPSEAPAISVGPNVKPPPEYKSRFPLAAIGPKKGSTAASPPSSVAAEPVEEQEHEEVVITPTVESHSVSTPVAPVEDRPSTPATLAPPPSTLATPLRDLSTISTTATVASSSAQTSPSSTPALLSPVTTTATSVVDEPISADTPSSPAVASASAPTPTVDSPAAAAAAAAAAPLTPKSPPPSVWGAAGPKKSWASLLRSPGSSSAPPPLLANGQPAPAIKEHVPKPSPSARKSLAATLAAVDLSALATSGMVSPRGLVNNGNLCFANAILQVLVYCSPLRGLLEAVRREVKANLGDKVGSLEAMIAFVEEFRSTEDPSSTPRHRSKSSLNLPNGIPPSSTPTPSEAATLPPVTAQEWADAFVPSLVYESLKPNKRFDAMTRGQQEDAEEFLGFFLDTLHEELLAVVDRVDGKVGREVESRGEEGEGWEEVGSKGRTVVTRTTETRESPITKIFGGQLRSVLRCSGQKDSITLEPYQRLQLDIQPDGVRTIEDALRNLTLPEPLPDFVSRSGLRVEATKQVYLESFPPVLILHLKRFLYDNVGGVQKSAKIVGYGTELEVGEEVVGPSQRTGRKVRYQLFGVVYHHGVHASGGHYTVAVRQQVNSNSWLHIDDTAIRPISPADVAVGRDGACGSDGEAKGAYLLLYNRMA